MRFPQRMPDPRGLRATALAAALLCLWALPLAAQSEADCTKVHEIDITHIFTPGDIEIRAGECVRFTNIHSIEHSAVGLEREFNTGTLLPGGTSLIPFEEPREIPYWCGLHPPMQGTIVVKPKGG